MYVHRTDKHAPTEGAAREAKVARRGSKAQQEEGRDAPEKDRRRVPEEKKVEKQCLSVTNDFHNDLWMHKYVQSNVLRVCCPYTYGLLVGRTVSNLACVRIFLVFPFCHMFSLFP